MDIMDFIGEHSYILVPFLWVIGYILKEGFDRLKNKYIPFILLIISIGFTPWFLGGFTPDNIIQAVLVAGGAVFVDQLYKQARKDE